MYSHVTMKPRAWAVGSFAVRVTVGAFVGGPVLNFSSALAQTFPPPLATMRYVYVRSAFSPSISARWVGPATSILPPLPLLISSAAGSSRVNSIRASLRPARSVDQLTTPTVGIAVLSAPSMAKRHTSGVPIPAVPAAPPDPPRPPEPTAASPELALAPPTPPIAPPEPAVPPVPLLSPPPLPHPTDAKTASVAARIRKRKRLWTRRM